MDEFADPLTRGTGDSVVRTLAKINGELALDFTVLPGPEVGVVRGVTVIIFGVE